MKALLKKQGFQPKTAVIMLLSIKYLLFMAFTLNVKIDTEGLKKIYSVNQTVSIVKTVTVANQTQYSNNISWINFQPLQNNFVTWNNSYFIYATTAPLKAGQKIVLSSQTDTTVQTGLVYWFNDGYFTPEPSDASESFRVNNQMQGRFGFGLAQQAEVNNVSVLSPLNVVPVLFNQSTCFLTTESIYIFLSYNTVNGVFIDQIPSSALTLNLSQQSPSATIGFNNTTNQFYLISQSTFNTFDLPALFLPTAIIPPRLPLKR